MLEANKRCIEQVPQPPHYLYRLQCSRKAGYGLGKAYCKQHAKRHPDRDKDWNRRMEVKEK